MILFMSHAGRLHEKSRPIPYQSRSMITNVHTPACYLYAPTFSLLWVDDKVDNDHNHTNYRFYVLMIYTLSCYEKAQNYTRHLLSAMNPDEISKGKGHTILSWPTPPKESAPTKSERIWQYHYKWHAGSMTTYTAGLGIFVGSDTLF